MRLWVLVLLMIGIINSSCAVSRGEGSEDASHATLSLIQKKTISNERVLVNFYRQGCAPCQRAIEAITAASNADSKLIVVHVNVIKNAMLTDALGIQGLPTIIVFRMQAPVAIIEGAPTKEQLVKLLNQIYSAPMAEENRLKEMRNNSSIDK